MTARRIKLCLHPRAEGDDPGDGGIRRVVEGMQRHFPAAGVDLVDDPAKADILAAHIEIPEVWLTLFPDKPIVAMNHGLYWSDVNGEWPTWAKKANRGVMEAIRVADAVTVPSRWVADVITRHTCRVPRVIPHGLDLEEWARDANKIGDDSTIVPYVLWDKTRPDPVCDPTPVNEVARLLPDVQFVTTFGEPAPNVMVTGRQPFAAAKALVQNAAVYLATSRETFGVATLQALACGVPVAGYQWGAQPEILSHWGDSYLAAPGDVADLAEGIRWCLKNREEAGAMARGTAEGYSWPRAIEQYADLFRHLLAERKARAQRPRVSVVVTAYKLERYLPACIDSVTAQTDADWELIVVNDASPDQCGFIANQQAHYDKRITVIHNPVNLYQSGARNAGIAAARGRYILPLDADDMLAPNAIQVLADELDKDRSIHVAYGNVRFVKDDGATPMVYGEHEPGHSGWPFEFDFRKQIRGFNLLPYCSMFRREAWEATAGYRERLRNDDDPDFWLRLASYGFRPRKVTDADTLIYRVRPGSMSQSVPHVDWASWFGWRGAPERSPAGTVGLESLQLPIPTWTPPAISVVIPVGRGHERLVMTAIDSLEAQTFGWFEAIVVNDTGTDLRLPPWVKRIDVSGDRGGPLGVAEARNAGAVSAIAPHLLFLDADDYLQPDALAIWAKVARERPETVFYADMWEDVAWGDPDGSGERQVVPLPPGKLSRFSWPDAEGGEQVLRGAVGAITQLIPRKAFEAVGGFEEGPWEDWAFLLKLARAGWCSARIARPLWVYRKRTGTRRDGWLAKDAYPDAKASILREFGQFFPADANTPPKERLMSCGCSGRATATYGAPAVSMGGNPETEAYADAQLMRYVGPAVAEVDYRGPTGQRYKWSKGRQQYVLPGDVTHFAGMTDDFVILDTAESLGPVGPDPVLVA